MGRASRRAEGIPYRLLPVKISPTGRDLSKQRPPKKGRARTDRAGSSRARGARAPRKARKSDSTEGESPSRCRRVGSQMDRRVTAQAPQVCKSAIQPFLSRSSKGGMSLESHDNNVGWVRCVSCKLGVSPDCDRAFKIQFYGCAFPCISSPRLARRYRFAIQDKLVQRIYISPSAICVEGQWLWFTPMHDVS